MSNRIEQTGIDEFSVFFESTNPGDDQIRSLMIRITEQQAEIERLKEQVCRWAEESMVAREIIRELEEHLSGAWLGETVPE